MTLRGYQPLPASCQAIYSFDLTTYELKAGEHHHL